VGLVATKKVGIGESRMNFSHEKNPGKNVTGIAIVIVLHLIVAYGIVTGLGKRMVTKMAEAVETKIIEDVKPPPPPETPPPPPPPEMKAPPPPFIPPVEVQVQTPPPQQNVIANTTAQKMARPCKHGSRCSTSGRLNKRDSRIVSSCVFRLISSANCSF
jgi:type IV secretory pathway VirB10-like protein